MGMTFTLFDSDGYRLQITGFKLGGTFFAPRMIIDGQVIDPKGNGIEIKGIEVTMDQVKALFAFFMTPDNTDLRDAAKQAAQDSFTNSIKGIMQAARG